MNLFNKEEKTITEPFVYTEDQLMARLRFFIGICLALTLTGIVFVVLYSIIFVTQPLNAMSPIDQKFFELIIPIATFLTGTLSGIMLAGNDKDLKAQAISAANRPTTVSPMPSSPAVSSSFRSTGVDLSPSFTSASSMPAPSFAAPPMGVKGPLPTPEGAITPSSGPFTPPPPIGGAVRNNIS